jgi:hypothetical protein
MKETIRDERGTKKTIKDERGIKEMIRMKMEQRSIKE